MVKSDTIGSLRITLATRVCRLGVASGLMAFELVVSSSLDESGCRCESGHRNGRLSSTRGRTYRFLSVTFRALPRTAFRRSDWAAAGLVRRTPG